MGNEAIDPEPAFVVSSFAVDYSDRIWVTDPDATNAIDLFCVALSTLLMSLLLGIIPYAILLLGVPGAVVVIVSIWGYHQIGRFLLHDSITPGIGFAWWALSIVLSQILIVSHQILVIVRELGSKPALPSIFHETCPDVVQCVLSLTRLSAGNFAFRTCFRFRYFLLLYAYALKPQILRGSTCFAQHGFAVLERQSRLIVVSCHLAFITILHIFQEFSESCSHVNTFHADNRMRWIIQIMLLRFCANPLVWFLGEYVEKMHTNPEMRVTHCYSLVLYSLYFKQVRRLLCDFDGIGSFMGATALHAASEFVSFVVLFAPSLLTGVRSLSRWLVRLCNCGRDLDLPQVYQDAIRKQSVEYGNRLFIRLVTLALSAVQHTAMTYFPEDSIYDQDLVRKSSEHYGASMYRITALVVFELIFGFLVLCCNRRRVFGSAFMSPWLDYIKTRRRRYLLVLVSSSLFGSTALRLIQNGLLPEGPGDLS